MLYEIKESTNNPEFMFVLNGLEYNKFVYTIEYGSYEDDNGTPVNVTIGVINKYTGEKIVPAIPYYQYSDGLAVFSSLATLISHLSDTLGFYSVKTFIDSFFARVTSSGGIVEGKNCLKLVVNELPDYDLGRHMTDIFRTRITNASTFFEGRQCVINTINELP